MRLDEEELWQDLKSLQPGTLRLLADSLAKERAALQHKTNLLRAELERRSRIDGRTEEEEPR